MKARARHRRGLRAGYTLVELLIAILITSIVVGALYNISRTATEGFNQQQRAAEMQLRLRFAMEQLRADVARAGYMASPNTAMDPAVCPRPTAALQAVTVTRDASAVPNPTSNVFLNPVVLRMVGNYVTADEYLVAGITVAGGIGEVQLQNQTPQWARVTSVTEFNRVFLPPGQRRMLRITSPTGAVQFVQVTAGVYETSGSAVLPRLSVTPAPALVGDGLGSGASSCGIAGLGVGATVAPITMVEYFIGNVAGAMPDLYPTDATAAALKTDLLRREYNLQPAVTLIPGSLRIVGEYAVDFDIALAVDDGNPIGSLAGTVALRGIDFRDGQIDTLLASAASSGAARPQRARALTVRLSIREREQDRDFSWIIRSAATEALTRFRVFTDRPGASRVRTLTAEVGLPNLAVRNLR